MPMPPKVNFPKDSTIPPMPQTRISETMHRLRASVRSSPARTSVLRPTTVIAPKSRSMMPPMTGTGIVCSSAPTFPTKASRMAKIAAQVMMAGLKARVRVTAPVTSE